MTRKEIEHDTMPASVGLVKEVRNELHADFRSLKHEVKSFKQEMNSLKFEVNSLKLEMNSKFSLVDSKFETVIGGIHRTQVMMEEQRGENKIVLDGLATVLERQGRIEGEVARLKEAVGV